MLWNTNILDFQPALSKQVVDGATRTGLALPQPLLCLSSHCAVWQVTKIPNWHSQGNNLNAPQENSSLTLRFAPCASMKIGPTVCGEDFS